MQIIQYYKNISLENIEGEIWNPVKEYAGVYASSLGRIKSDGRFVKIAYGERYVPTIVHSQYKGKDDYLRVSIRVNGKEKKVTAHRLCALAFCPNPENKKTVQHKNGIKWCNQDWNICWFTQSEQLKDTYDRGNRKNTWWNKKGGNNHNAVKVVCINTGKIYDCMSVAAKENNISRHYLTMLCNGYAPKTNRGKGLKFSYHKEAI